MKEMPTNPLPADSFYEYDSTTDNWIVKKKSGNKVLSKKEITASITLLARLNQIKANILKNAVQKQDVVDFYLLSLLPAEYLSKSAIGPEHIDGLTLYQGIIETLRDEYVRRGMEELKDEAETTRWNKAIPAENMPDEIKPYYKYHETGYGYSGNEEDEEDDNDYEFPYHCSSCGVGLSEDDAYNWNDEYYCEECRGKAIEDTITSYVLYCKVHNVFALSEVPLYLTDDITDVLEGMGYKVSADESHFNEDENDSNLVRYQRGQKVWEEVKENLKKQLQFKFKERPKKSGLKRLLSKKAERGGPWYEAPYRFDDLTSADYYKLFEYAPWKESFGGPAWAEIAKTIGQLETETNWQKMALLIDHFHDLGHNTGKLLDKFPEWTEWFKSLLDLKASKDAVRQLMPLASSEVRNLVQEYYAVQRGEDWRKYNYPTKDFSQNDLRTIERDPHAPPTVLFNASKFAIDTGDGYFITGIFKHPNLDKKTLKKILSYLDLKKADFPSYWMQSINQELERLGLVKKQPKKPTPSPKPTSQPFKVGDRVVLEENASVGAGKVVELLDNGFVSVKWNSPAEGEYPHSYLPDSLTKVQETPSSSQGLKVGDRVYDTWYGTNAVVTAFLPDGGIQIQLEDGSMGIRDLKHLEKAALALYQLRKFSKKDKIAYEGWPTEQDSVQFGIAPPGWMANEPWKGSTPESQPENISEIIEYYIHNPHPEHGTIVDLSIDDRTLKFEDGFTISFDDVASILKQSKTKVAPKPDRGSDDPEVNDYSQNYEWGPRDLGRVPNKQPGDSFWQPWGTEDSEGVSSNVVMSSFSAFMRKQGSLNKSSITKNYALYIGPALATRTMTRWKAEKILKERFPEAYANGNYAIVEEEYKTSSLSKSGHCGPCQIPTTEILMADGTLKQIELIIPGDMVITHTGEPHKVTDTMRRWYEGDIFNLKVYGINQTLSYTPEHPFYTNKLIQFETSSGSVMEKVSTKQYLKMWVETKDLLKSDFLLSPQFAITQDNILTNGQARLLGYYLSEGCLYKQYGKNRGVRFAFNRKETDFISDVQNLLFTEFGIKSTLGFWNHKNALSSVVIRTLRTNTKDAVDNFVNFVTKYGGEYAATKRLNSEILTWPNSLIKELLIGYFCGDGGIQKNTGDGTHTETPYYLCATSASKNLISQISVLLTKLGIPHSTRLDIRKLSSKGKKCNHFWIGFKVKSEDRKAIFNRPTKEGSLVYSILEDYIGYKIKNIEKIHYAGYVYNLEVEKDNSYVAYKYAVHNCSPLKMEVLRTLIDLSYKDQSLFPVELIEKLAVSAAELKLDNFNSILKEAIGHLEKREKDVGDKLPKLKNFLIALEDINPKLGEEITVVDKPLGKKESRKVAYRPIKNVLIICSGNTCRSPMAENILKQMRPDLNVVSRGLYASGKGLPMTPDAVKALQEKGIPVSPHLSQSVTEADVQKADLILVMENWQKDDLEAYIPASKGKVALIGDVEIPDPVGRDAKEYEKVRDDIAKALSRFASLDKQARYEIPYWIDPKGKEYKSSNASHDIWVEQNKDMLARSYSIDLSKMDARDSNLSYLLGLGWTRAAASDSLIYFDRENLKNIFVLDDFVAQHWIKDSTQYVLIDTTNEGKWIVHNPFPNLESARREPYKTEEPSWAPKLASLDIPQDVQNQIAKQYGPEILVGLRFYENALTYGHDTSRALDYALAEMKRMGYAISEREFLKVFDVYGLE